MNIDEMEAGREMDAMVHEKVLDYHGAYRYEGAFGHKQIRHVSEGCPHYSTDIAAAWQVVEKMQKICRIDIENYKWAIRPGNTVVCIYSTDFPNIRVEAPTAPLAICRAALKAVEE